MATMTFQLNDANTDNTNPSVWVSITEVENGALSFTITQENSVMSDLCGVFFDIADENQLSTFKINTDSSDIRIGKSTGISKSCDVGIKIGAADIGKDDILGYTFTVGSTTRNLTLDDFSQVDFDVEKTSTGMLSENQTASSNLSKNTAITIQLANIDTQLVENTSISGNPFSSLQLKSPRILRRLPS